MDTYKINIAGLDRELPLCAVNENLKIAALVIFNDVELTIASAAELIKKIPEFDVIVTPEAKSIPLAYEMARQSGKPYFVARKGEKLYMSAPAHVDVKSITTNKVQTLYLDSGEGEQLRGKRVAVIDDVISTGESLKAVNMLVKSFGGDVVTQAAILAEGDAANRDDIVFLGVLPLFFT